MLIVELLNKLIEKKFYTKEKIQNKINVFYAMNVLDEEQFAELTLKVETEYVEETEEKNNTEDNEEDVEENA